MKNIKFLLLILFPLHLGLLLFFFLDPNGLHDVLYFLLGYILIGGLGVNVGLHRWASHRSVRLKSFVKPVVIFFSIMSCQGHPIWWATVHRGYHHKNADTEADPHTPKHGMWHSFLGWIIAHDVKSLNYKYSSDLFKDRLLNRTLGFYEMIIWITWIISGLISLNFLLFFFVVPTIIAFHSEGLVNTFCHSSLGYRNFNTNDNSKNISILGYFAWGNGWHNNHHENPGSFDFGKNISGKKKEFDPCTIFLPFIKTR